LHPAVQQQAVGKRAALGTPARVFASTGRIRPLPLSADGSILSEVDVSIPLAIPAGANALEAAPLDLSLSLLARQRSFKEWQAEGTGGGVLRTCKLRAGRSLYLYHESRGTAVLRARLRFNRASLEQSLHMRGLAVSPTCFHVDCRRAGLEDTVDHALLHCPLIRVERERCRNQLAALNPPIALTLQVALGSLPKPRKSSVPVLSVLTPLNFPSAVLPRGGFSAPTPVYLPNNGLPRPRAPLVPTTSLRKKELLKPTKAALYITQALLRALLIAHDGHL
jgi:hypothetical protein